MLRIEFKHADIMKQKLHFIIGRGVYPHKVGGMEVFNYYIKTLKEKFNLSYQATIPYNFNGAKWSRTFTIKPTKLFSPLQVLIYLLFHPSVKKVVISFSEAHWLIWYLYTRIATLLHRDYYVIIHFGKTTPKDSYNVYKNFFDKAKKVIAVSHDIKKNYDSKYGINCEVQYPLVPFKEHPAKKEELRKEYNIPADANIVCMVGTIKEMKHPETILDAVAMFSNEEIVQHNPHIVYAGSGNMIQTLKDKAKEYGIEERVHFLGFVPKEEVNKVFKVADAYIIASDFEGTSVSLLEAMYNKKAIIASNAPGINDMIKNRESGLLFETGNASEVKKLMITYFTQPELVEKLSDGAYKVFNSKYNYNKMIENYEKIFNK